MSSAGRGTAAAPATMTTLSVVVDRPGAPPQPTRMVMPAFVENEGCSPVDRRRPRVGLTSRGRVPCLLHAMVVPDFQERRSGSLTHRRRTRDTDQRMDTGTPPVLKVSHYEKAERDRIRRILLRYMEENRIGVPKLQMLILRANGYSADQIDNVPLKTLQRFLDNRRRTNDTFITLCARFADDLPDDDPVANLGTALTGFMRSKGPAPEADPGGFPAALLGTYDGTLEIAGRQADAPHSRLRLDRALTGPPSRRWRSGSERCGSKAASRHPEGRGRYTRA